MSWQTIDHTTSVDVVPLHDAKEHAYGDECWCNPTVEQTKGVPLITHNSTRERAISREQLWDGVPLEQALQDVVARSQTGYKYAELKDIISTGDDLLDTEDLAEVDKTVNLLQHLFFYYTEVERPRSASDDEGANT